MQLTFKASIQDLVCTLKPRIWLTISAIYQVLQPRYDGLALRVVKSRD
jgi:hypothetical protein